MFSILSNKRSPVNGGSGNESDGLLRPREVNVFGASGTGKCICQIPKGPISELEDMKMLGLKEIHENSHQE